MAMAIGIIGFVAAPVSAQQAKCAPRAAILSSLGSSYSEAPVGVGVTQQGALVEVLASDSGSWSIIVSSADGVACLVAAGEGWRVLTPAAPEDPMAALPETPETGT